MPIDGMQQLGGVAPGPLLHVFFNTLLNLRTCTPSSYMIGTTEWLGA